MVSAVRTLPDQFSVFFYDLDFACVTAHLTEITLCIQFCVHDIVINVLHYCKYCIQILLHIRYFHVADRTTRRQLLELRFEFQFFESVDVLCYVYMIAVCDVVFVCYTRDQSKTFLQTFCKFVSGGLKRCAIQTEVYVVLCFPLVADIVHMLHYFQCKRCCTWICVGFSCHITNTFAQTCISQ